MEVEEPAAAIGLEPPPPSNFKAEQESLEAQSEFLGVGQELGKRPSSDDIPVAISLNELQGSDGDEILHGAVIDWIKSRISLPGYHAEEHWMSKHDEVVVNFASEGSSGRLFASILGGELCLSAQVQHIVAAKGSTADTISQPVAYFLRSADALTDKPPQEWIQYGVVHKNAVQSLMRLMQGVFTPKVFSCQTGWPDTVKKDLTSQFHRFMASLVETSNQSQGKTVLYLPSELEDIQDVRKAASNKDTVQHLESIVIHWTRQIKDVVNNHDMALDAEILGPLEEIEFWCSRTVDLSGIGEQLNREDVKRVTCVLKASESSYLGPFVTLSQRIQEGCTEAISNLKFLESLKVPCQNIAAAIPADIPDLLPNLLNCIRMIWNLSGFYNTEERLTGLLRKISNSIIARCCAVISLDDMLEGRVETAMEVLTQSRTCGMRWKSAYRTTVTVINTYEADESKQWKFDDASIFAQIDAFVQRCSDLLEICEGQIQFSRKSSSAGGMSCNLPEFGGARGPEITKALLGIQASFEDQIDILKSLDYDILDVKTSRWHEDYNAFKNVVKDLEVMYTNVINTSFEGLTRVPDAVALLEIFYHLARKQAIRQTCLRKTIDVYVLFTTFVSDLRREFDEKRRLPPLRANEPPYSGSALWANSLGEMVSKSWEMLRRCKHLVKSAARDAAEISLHVNAAKDAEMSYSTFMGVIADFTTARYQAWVDHFNELDANALAERLNNPLLRRAGPADMEASGSSVKPGHLVCNFDHELLELFAEVSFWEKFQGDFSVPYVAHDICNQRERLRAQREHVMLIVAAYNLIVDDLSASERKIFNDHIRRLDKRIHQGLTKLTWSSQGVVEFFVRDCCAHCEEMHSFVHGIHGHKEAIQRHCRALSSLLLVKIDKNLACDDKMFAARQSEHCISMRSKMVTTHNFIVDAMRGMFDVVKEGGSEVKREWRALVAKVDKDIESALRQAVKRSLQELSRAINGDAKTEPQTLFNINIVLEAGRMDYRPTMINLTHAVNIVAKELISTINVVPRLREVLAQTGSDHPKGKSLKLEGSTEVADPASSDQAPVAAIPAPSTQPTFYNLISNDEETLKIVVHVMNGMSASATELQKYLSYWDKYKYIWENDKDGFIRRYAKASRGLAQFDADTMRYKELQTDIQNEEGAHTINFIKIDCTSLKTALIGHCVQWQGKLTGLLNQNAQVELRNIHEVFNTSTVKLRQPPKNLDELSLRWNLLEQMQKEYPTIREKFGPVEEMYALLAKFEVGIAEEEQGMIGSLHQSGDDFAAVLEESEASLNKAKVAMKRDLESAISTYNESVMELHEAATLNLPYKSDMPVSQALDVIQQFKSKLATTQQTQMSMQAGLDVFHMDTPEHVELREVQRDIELLEQIWGISSEWEALWSGWKTGLFESLDVSEMESVAAQYNKKIGKLGRDIKKWKIWETMKDRIQQFQQTMPLIQDLKNPALRIRHWESLRTEVGRFFDPLSAGFNLEAVLSLGLHQHVDFISELSANANKELSIEQSLASIALRWQSIDIETAPYKGTYKISSTDDLFQVLEDDSVQLSTIKSSRFYPSFAEDVDRWEGALNTVSEVVEMLLSLQRKWIYLESIFMASEDICRQLPQESALFMDVNAGFAATIEHVYHDPNAYRACCDDPEMLSKLVQMDEKLEHIQKSLDQYLETKRIIFPRFYFVSDDDLLEVLGQGRDPMAVQKHLKKCFEGVKSAHLVPPTKSPSKQWEATGLTSPDGEGVELASSLILEGPVEQWLSDLELSMQVAIQKILALSIQAYKGKKEKWVRDFQGQILITTGAIQWTADCSRALGAISAGNKGALKALKKKQTNYLNKLSDMVRGQLSRIERNKVVALITMEIHNRDVMERMIKSGCSSTQDFEWLCQLRFVFEKEKGQFGMCRVRQTNCELEYSYEYQGNNGRLVVTPLTDRCVLTLTTAMFLHRGGNPLGPAGTGKTETVKDLGKNLAKYVVVINCSDGMDYKSVGRIFSGLVQSGSWGCFDEFNRIKVEVISVVAMQVLSIVNALSAKQPSFTFMGSTIKCNPTTGLFITMNPGYAGRTELPDNLKALMRPVAMMTPDLSMIAEVMLAAEGFRDARNLAKKTVTLYSLMIQQLSKQDHYDYGLRNLKAVLNMAGSLKRADPDMNEEAILMRALRDMNLPKFIQDDERLFRLLLGDLFPSLELPVSEHGVLQAAIDSCLMGEGLQKHPFLSGKVLQLYDSKLTRHCNMLVGSTLAGKTVAWKMLMQAMCSLNKEGQQGFMPVTPFVINPKSVTLSELYGAYDLATFEWTDGILSTIFKSCAEDSRPIEKWIVFDGPVDALWIESMNSVMDDNKILTLINGDRIPLSSTMSLVFEVEDLAVASPATVSRAGMVYMDAVEMGWKPYAQSWLQQHFGEDAEGRELHEGFFDKYVEPVLQHKAAAELREPVPICDFNAVQSLCALYDSFRFDPECEVVRDADGYHSIAEKWFVFALIWSVCAAVDEKGRCSLDIFLRDIEAQFPPSATVYDYFIDLKRRDWELWESRVASFRSWKGMPFHAMIVPTIDTTRNGYILSALCKNKRNTLIVGASGTGKTVLSASELSRLPETHSQLMINFSATTDSGTTQSMIESCMEKRSKDKIGPAGGKQLVCFIDDFNMPLRTSSESPFQPPLELLRFWMDHGGWYDRAKCTWRHVLGMQLICAMAPPGGARAEISARTQSRFNVLNVTFPGDPQVIRIFETILGTRFAELDNDIKTLSSKIAAATLRVYHSTVATFLPTPAKSHYLFNMRDPARVVEGLLQASPKVIDTQDSLLRLWAHECCRSFSDRFVADAADDESRFADIVCEQLGTFFDTDWETLHRDCDAPALGSIFSSAASLGDEGDEVEYSEHTSIGKLREAMEERLEDYNLEPKLVSMDLVLFADAVRHLCRIHRVLRLRRGSIMLVGVGGSGRQSLTRLAAFMCGCDVFSIEITKNYRRVDFREDLKALFDQTGIQGRQVVFLFNDNQVKEEGFLEDINNILQSGQVPNLYARDEIGPILDAVRKPARAAGVEETGDALWEFFVGRVRDNLHLVLAMSPVGTSFRSRCRSYPGLVNCMTIDWFQRWPADALVEVANRFISDVPMDDEAHRSKVALIFSTVHTSVVDASTKMLEEMKRHNYVTPTNYLELVKGYRTILAERRSTINDSCNKLRNGLTKLEEAREQVEVMSVELETKKVVVAKAQRDCEELLVEIVSERRIADEQKKQVEAESQKIAKEEGECKAIADDAQADLAVAMPALEKAMAEVDKLDKGSITEVKAYSKPPALVETVLSAVMVLFGKATDWGTAKQMLGRSDFLQSIKTYDKDNVANTLMNKVKKYVTNPDFEPDNVAKVSSAAATLCVWVHAIYIYSTVARDVAPKRERLKGAQELLAQKQANLKAAQEALAEVVAKVDSLKQRYDESVSQKNDLMQESQMLQEKLGRADKLVTGLAGEYARWQISIGSFELRLSQLVGDSLLAAGFLSYAGPFDTSYRASLVQAWSTAVRGAELPSADDFSFKSFLADPTDIRLWSIQGLPKDDFSAENGVMVTRSSRWPLMIDPQGQANRWVRAMEKERGLRVIDLHMKDCLRELGNCIAYGLPCLLQDVLEELDPAIEPVLSKAIIRQGNREVIRLGDKELDWSKDFRLYITTTLSNPHYTPEVSTKTTVVNFSVKQEGLEAQLLGIVVQEEEPALEEQASELTLRVAQGKKKLVDLEDEILQLLSQSSGSLLDDLALVDALQQSKTTSEEVTQQLQVAEETSLKIDAAREGYRAAAVRASIAYFVLIDLSRVDPMYQFSLDAYVNLFHGSIEESRRSQGRDEEPLTPAERCLAINTVHTLRTYRYTCRGLFERHKLLFSMQLCFQILMQQAGKVQPEEFNFLLHGGAVVDRSQEKVNPAKDWLDQSSWDNIIALDKLAGFSGLAASFEQVPREWKAWYLSGKPESSSLIGDWETRLSDLQRMCLLRALRRDRILHSAAAFVSANLGPAFADPPAFDLRAVFKDSTCRMPLIFVLSPGVDPTAQVASLASSVGVEMETVALGQGQAPTAMAMLEEGSRSGKWVFLANCHLMLSWMADLEKAVEELLIRPDLNPRFRLWLSSAPHPKFPISILQRGIKMTTEPPSGLRANLLTLYNTVTPEQFSRCGQVSKYRKLLFSLCWFHAILLERRKFKSLGFNIPYEFNESDFSICHDLIIVYLDEYVDKTPYDAMRYLIAEANYGGRVTDDWDRRLVNVYIHQFFCEAVLEEDHYPLSSLKEYFIPSDGDLASYKDVISYLPKTDHAEAFGQHPNADIVSMMEDATSLLGTMAALQPRAKAAEGESAEVRALNLAGDLLSQLPEPLKMSEVRAALNGRSDPDPLKTVLLQEVERYNLLLVRIASQLKDLQSAAKGLIAVTPELEEVMDSILSYKVPSAWGTCFPSLKLLAAWMKDLEARAGQVAEWARSGPPPVFWLPGMTYPTGFLTALLQTSARRNGIAIDTLSWDFGVLTMPEKDLTAGGSGPKEGAYCHGLFLEGAKWNKLEGCLAEPEPMQLYCEMPVIHFKPVEGRRKGAKGFYSCPIYMYPLRTGTRERPSFVIAADLKAGKMSSAFWAKRGVGLLLSTPS